MAGDLSRLVAVGTELSRAVGGVDLIFKIEKSNGAQGNWGGCIREVGQYPSHYSN